MSGRPWTAREIGYLRRWYRRRSIDQAAEVLGRSRVAVRQMALKLGLRRMERRWPPKDVAYLRRWYGKKPAAEIGVHLGRAKRKVLAKAMREGLTRRQRRLGEPWEKTLRELNAKGYTDAEIARRLKCDRRELRDWRHKLGLPSNAFSERRRRQVARKTREQLRKAGLKSMAELRILRWRDFARRSGWPEDLRFRAVQILNALWERGPMTRRQIAAAIGVPWKGVRNTLVSNDSGHGSYLAALAARGLVVRMRRAVKGAGKGQSCDLYALPLFVEPNRKESCDGKTRTAAGARRRDAGLAQGATGRGVQRDQCGRREGDRRRNRRAG